MPVTWSRTAIVRRHASPLTAAVGHDVVLFDETTDQYFLLNAVAAMIWRGLEEPKTVEQVIDGLRMRFQAGDRDIARETEAFLDELRRQSLIEIVANAESLPEWEPPVLTALDVTVTAGGVVNDVESNGGIWS